MKISSKQLYICALAMLVTALAFSCKKPEEKKEEESKTLKGIITTAMPAYAFVGETLEMYLGCAAKEDGDTLVGMWWKISVDDVADTLRREKDPASVKPIKKYTVPDTLDKFTVTVCAFAEGYSSITATSNVVFLKDTLDGRGSIKGIIIEEGKDFYETDLRDSTTYLCRAIGDNVWMRQNLAYEKNSGDKSGVSYGYAYDNEPRLSKTFGRYYTWHEAIKVCPNGWRLPTEKDWVNLASTVISDAEEKKDFRNAAGKFMADAYFNGSKLWEYWPHDVKITDESRFSALPTGYGNIVGSTHSIGQFMSYSAFWTAQPYADSTQAIFRYIYEKSDDVYADYGSANNLLLNVRCVRDKKEGE